MGRSQGPSFCVELLAGPHRERAIAERYCVNRPLHAAAAYVVILFAALFATGCSGSPSSQSAAVRAARSADPSDVLQRYVAAEDNDFADLQGDPTGQSRGYHYYTVTQSVPAMKNCVVYTYESTKTSYASCDVDTKGLPSGKALYQTWQSDVQSAEPYWHAIAVQPLPSGDVAATMYADGKEQHAILLSLVKGSGATYRVTLTLAKMAALRG